MSTIEPQEINELWRKTLIQFAVIDDYILTNGSHNHVFKNDFIGKPTTYLQAIHFFEKVDIDKNNDLTFKAHLTMTKPNPNFDADKTGLPYFKYRIGIFIQEILAYPLSYPRALIELRKKIADTDYEISIKKLADILRNESGEYPSVETIEIIKELIDNIGEIDDEKKLVTDYIVQVAMKKNTKTTDLQKIHFSELRYKIQQILFSENGIPKGSTLVAVLETWKKLFSTFEGTLEIFEGIAIQGPKIKTEILKSEAVTKGEDEFDNAVEYVQERLNEALNKENLNRINDLLENPTNYGILDILRRVDKIDPNTLISAKKGFHLTLWWLVTKKRLYSDLFDKFVIQEPPVNPPIRNTGVDIFKGRFLSMDQISETISNIFKRDQQKRKQQLLVFAKTSDAFRRSIKKEKVVV